MAESAATWSFANSMWWPSVLIWLPKRARLLLLKLVMNMYPTYAFFMPNGDILGTVSPFLLPKNPELFLERGKRLGSRLR